MPGKTFQSLTRSSSLSEVLGLQLWKVSHFQYGLITILHLRFRDSEFDEYALRIAQLGLEVKHGRDRVEGESRSIYFYGII